MSVNIKKVVIPISNDDEMFFPLARFFPKELLPMGDVPLIEKIIEEAMQAGIEEILFIFSSSKKDVFNYFQNTEKAPQEEEEFKKRFENISFSFTTQKKNIKNASAVFRARDEIGEDSFALSFPEIIFRGKKSCIEQLFAVYRTSQKQVAAVREVSDEEVPFSYIVEAEKIANRFYKIKKIIKNPDLHETQSRLALCGRYIFTSALFDYLKNAKSDALIADSLNEMIAAGKTIYAHESEGEWFVLRDKSSLLNAQRFFLENY